MSRIPPDFPNDAPLPMDRPRCPIEYDGKRCVRTVGHEAGLRRHPRHHLAADDTRWMIGPKSGTVQIVKKCNARYESYQCDRWPHSGYHGAQASPGQVQARHQPRIEWTGNGEGAEARERNQ